MLIRHGSQRNDYARQTKHLPNRRRTSLSVGGFATIFKNAEKCSKMPENAKQQQQRLLSVCSASAQRLLRKMAEQKYFCSQGLKTRTSRSGSAREKSSRLYLLLFASARICLLLYTSARAVTCQNSLNVGAALPAARSCRDLATPCHALPRPATPCHALPRPTTRCHEAARA